MQCRRRSWETAFGSDENQPVNGQPPVRLRQRKYANDVERV
jgi:hypothetical protein